MCRAFIIRIVFVAIVSVRFIDVPRLQITTFGNLPVKQLCCAPVPLSPH